MVTLKTLQFQCNVESNGKRVVNLIMKFAIDDYQNESVYSTINKYIPCICACILAGRPVFPNDCIGQVTDHEDLYKIQHEYLQMLYNFVKDIISYLNNRNVGVIQRTN